MAWEVPPCTWRKSVTDRSTSFAAWRSHLQKRTCPRSHGVIPRASHHVNAQHLRTSFTKHLRTLNSSPKISSLLRNVGARLRSPLFQRHFFRTPSRRHDVTCHVVALGVTYHVYRSLFGTLRTGTMWQSPHGLERREALLSKTCSEHPVRQSAQGARCVSQVPDGPQHVLELRLQRNTAQSRATACLTLVSPGR